MSNIERTEGEELRMLRARAYGPDADIGDDPAAVDRLRALEERAVTPVQDVDGPAVGRPTTDREPAAEDANSPVVESTPETAPRPAGMTVRPIAAAAIALALVAATAAATFFIVRAGEADPRTVATLAARPGVETVEYFGGDGSLSVLYEDFYGLTPIAAPGWAGQDEACLFLALTDEVGGDAGNGWQGIGNLGCAAGPFPAYSQFVVGSGITLPEDFRERFPDGTSLKFVQEGESVTVLTDAP